jgi:hypothetical protein
MRPQWSQTGFTSIIFGPSILKFRSQKASGYSAKLFTFRCRLCDGLATAMPQFGVRIRGAIPAVLKNSDGEVWAGWLKASGEAKQSKTCKEIGHGSALVFWTVTVPGIENYRL